MQNYEIFSLLAAFWVAIPLIRGAIEDIKTRQFPEKYWSPFAHIAGIFTFLMYCLMAADGKLTLIIVYAFLTLGALFLCYGIGIRYGSGGDWRAMMYCAVLTPLIFFSPIFWVLVCVTSLIIAFFVLAAKGSEHPFERHIPWAVAICVAFCITAAIAGMTGNFA